MKILLLGFCLLVLQPWRVATKPKTATILIVMDGLRHDYVTPEDTPHLNKMIDSGVFLPKIIPEFPSLKYPNIASLLTGMYTENHNVLNSESVFSVELNRTIFRNETQFWSKTKSIGTIWDAFRATEPSAKIATMGLPEIKNIWDEHPQSQVKPVNETSNNSEQSQINLTETHIRKKAPFRVSMDELNNQTALQKALKDLFNTDEKLFGTMFFNEPGQTAQAMGPDGAKKAIKTVDSIVGEILSYIQTQELSEVTNVIVCSTPGYTDVAVKDIISVKGLSQKKMKIFGESPIYHVSSVEASNNALGLYWDYQKVQADGGFKVYVTEAIPDKWHYKLSPDVVENSFMLVAKTGIGFAEDLMPRIEHLRAKYKRTNHGSFENEIYGSSGYDPSFGHMQTAFVATGPAFKSGLRIIPLNQSHAVSMVDLFPLLCHVLEIDPVPHRNGSLGHLMYVLAHPPSKGFKQTIDKFVKYVNEPQHLPLTVACLIALTVFAISKMCVLAARRRHRRLLAQQGFRYSQVRNNRRLVGNPEDDLDGYFDAEEDEEEGRSDKQELLRNSEDKLTNPKNPAQA
ncbi:glycerophosphocholine choline phosphodiesterase ENPP6-like isoform X1 [Tigriopus californicus]|nr:glycerophosphocholine choline phosphodiesterase ENPP6-like isoform X1 [Tigriopus californicus]